MRGGPSTRVCCVPAVNKLIHWRLHKIERKSTRKAFASQDTPNGSSSRVRRTLIAWLDVRVSFKSSPIALSEATLLKPSSDLSQPGVAPLMQALITEGAPNALVTLQTKPAGPLSPNASVSAMLDPMRVVKAATGMRPFSKLIDLMPSWSEGVAEVEFCIVSGGRFKYSRETDREPRNWVTVAWNRV